MLKCGLLGQKLGHSYSPAIHGMLANYDYQLFEREPEQLEDFLKNGPWDGINVTIPYKKAVLPYCAELSDTARRIGSVNTIVRRPDGSLYGDNTDAYGFESLVKKSGIDVRGKKALVLALWAVGLILIGFSCDWGYAAVAEGEPQSMAMGFLVFGGIGLVFAIVAFRLGMAKKAAEPKEALEAEDA